MLDVDVYVVSDKKGEKDIKPKKKTQILRLVALSVPMAG